MKLKTGSLPEKLFVIIPGIIFVISTVLLVDDSILFNSGARQASNLEIIGTITKSDRDVRRRLKSEFVWDSIKKLATVYQSDSIFTGKNSTAEITFADETKISISSDSLIIVDKNQLDVKQGSFVGNLGARSKLVVVIAGKKSEISSSKNAQFKINVSKSGKTHLLILKGKLSLKTVKGKQELNKNQSVNVDKEGTLSKVKTFEIEMTFPADGIVIWKSNDQKHVFKWKLEKRVDRFKFVVSKDKSFKRTLFSRETKSKKVIFKKLPTGSELYWRVQGFSGKKLIAEGPIYEFSVRKNPPPIPLGPVQGRYIIGKGVDVDFSWSDDTNATQFQLQLSRDPVFRKRFYDKQTGDISQSVSDLARGSWFWRVRITDGSRTFSSWSETKYFKVELPLIVPELDSPSNNKKYTIPNYTKKIKFEWDKRDIKDDNVEGFRLEIAKDGAFRTPVYTGPITLKFFHRYILKVPGKYFWRVRASKRKGQVVKYSEVYKLNLKLIPTLSHPENAKETIRYEEWGLRVFHQFKWDEVDDATMYYFQMATENGKNVIRKKITDEEFEWKRSFNNRFRWRVATYDKYKRRGKFTTWRKVITPKKVIAPTAPELLLPKNGKLFVTEGAQSVFTWEDEEEGPATIFQLSRDSKFKNLVYNEELKERRFESEELEQGTYFWRARVKEGERPPSLWSAIRSFRVTPPLKDTTLIAPIDGKDINVVKKKVAVKFYWETENNSGERLSFKVEVAKDSDFDEDDIIAQKEGMVSGMALMLPVPGAYYWRVKVTKVNGKVYKYTSSENFDVQMIPKLDPPGGNSYSVKFKRRKSIKTTVIDVIYLFEWSESDDAVAYLFQIAGVGGKIVFKKVVKNKAELQWLNTIRGAFRWRVTAIDKYRRLGMRGEWNIISNPKQLKIRPRTNWSFPLR